MDVQELYKLLQYQAGNPAIADEEAVNILKSGEKKAINPWPDEICKVPSRHILIGASEQGKTFALFKFLMSEKNSYTFPFGKTLYIIHPISKDQVKIKNLQEYLNKICLKHQKPDYKSLTVEVSKSLDNLASKIKDFAESCKQEHLNPLIIIDDAYSSDTMNSSFLVELYVKGRHLNISIALLTQVAFCNKVLKDLKRNSNYFWIFKCWTEDIIPIIKSSIDPVDQPAVWKAYQDHVFTKPKGYIVVEPFNPDPKLKIRINSFFPPGAKPKSMREIEKDFEEYFQPKEEDLENYIQKKIKKTAPKEQEKSRSDFVNGEQESSSSESDAYEDYMQDIIELRKLLKLKQ